MIVSINTFFYLRSKLKYVNQKLFLLLLFICCYPGIGKTVFTKKAAFDWSQQRYQETIGAFELVLLIRLRDVCNLLDVPSIFKASQRLANDGKISVDDLYDYVLNHQEKVLLILDGYDEYSAEEQSPIDEIV